MAEAEDLRFGFHRATLDNRRQVRRLEVAVTAGVFRLARERDEEIGDMLAELTGNQPEEDGRIHTFLETTDNPVAGEGGLSFAVDVAAIGRLKNVRNKLRQLDRINQLIGGLAAAAYPIIGERPLEAGDVRLEAYFPSMGGYLDGFTLIGQVYLPPSVPDVTLGEVALREMTAAAATVNCYLSVKYSTQGLGAEVDRGREVTLAQSMHSSIHTLADEIEEGNPVVRLLGNNLEPHEPLFYLIGMKALADAPELQGVA